MAINTRSRSLVRSILVAVALIGASVWWCATPPKLSSAATARLCAVADTAFATGDYRQLLQTAEEDFGVEQERMRKDDQGVFVPTWSFFVEERGLFIAKRGAQLTEGTDPGFSPIEACLYRYRIAG